MASRTTRFTTLDLYWTEDGDLDVTDGGDLKDTRESISRALTQEVRTVLKATPGEWRTEPMMGADLASIIGSVNSLEVADLVAEMVYRSLVDYNIIDINQALVLPIPVEDVILVRTIIETPGGDLTVQFGYDSHTRKFIGY